MSLPWYLRPLEPSRVPPWVGHILPSLFVAGFFVASAIYLHDVLPAVPPWPVLVIVAGTGWVRVAWGIRRRRETGVCPGFSIPGAALAASALTLLSLPSLVWPRASRLDPPPPLVSTVSLVTWCTAGVLLAVATYFMLSHTHGPRRGQHA